MSPTLIFFITFALMEFAAWSLHKYVMHGFLWNLHEDHHVPKEGHVFQKNDFFAFFFAVPSFLLILFGVQILANAQMAAVGFGIMAYGAAYFFVHEVIIHRRLKFIKPPKWRYITMLRAAHAHHHKIKGKYGCSNFGMLVVPLYYLGIGKKRS